MTSRAPYADTEWQPRTGAEATARRSEVGLGSLPENSEQDLRFVQDRLALYGKVTFFISGMFLVVTLVADTLRGVDRVAPIGRISHAFGTVLALVLWRVARRTRRHEPDVLQAIDLAATIGLCVAFVSMGHHALQPYGFYTAMLAVSHVSVCRAMIVPSTPRRTLLVGVFGFGGFLVSRGILPPPVDVFHVYTSRTRNLVEALLWSTAGTAVATVASKVIYGLHEKAREARQLGQYALEEKIGEGGMGKVYRARHAMLRRPTAVKLLSGNGSEHQLRRFEREVQLTARLTHPNTISVYDYGRTPDGIFYYAMELLEGLTLEQLVERHGPQPAGRVIHLLRQVCGALHEAHGIGLIHRDIKPANIFLCRRGGVYDVIKVLDFGLVHELKSNDDLTGSQVDALVGTPLYMSPESIRTPDQVDARTDIYALGGVAYFLLTGSPPFTGRSIVELCAAHLHTPPEPPSKRHTVPDDLERVILSCLSKDRADRPQRANALARELAACRDAGAWGDVDAEAWWADVGGPVTPAPPRSSRSGEHTIVAVDLHRRLGIDRKPA